MSLIDPATETNLLKRFVSWLTLSGRALVIAIPTIWLLIFFLIPFAVVAKISFSEVVFQNPPYLPLLEWTEDGRMILTLNFGNYQFLFDDPLYINAYISSIKIAFISTVMCLLIGYPMAYYIARAEPRTSNILLMLVILPFWSSFLLRVYAWIGFLKGNGVINNVLMKLGIISAPIQMLQTDFAVYIGITYTYLPFIVDRHRVHHAVCFCQLGMAAGCGQLDCVFRHGRVWVYRPYADFGCPSPGPGVDVSTVHLSANSFHECRQLAGVFASANRVNLYWRAHCDCLGALYLGQGKAAFGEIDIWIAAHPAGARNDGWLVFGAWWALHLQHGDGDAYGDNTDDNGGQCVDVRADAEADFGKNHHRQG